LLWVRAMPAHTERIREDTAVEGRGVKRKGRKGIGEGITIFLFRKET
jgi:hypothetical protein